MDKDIQAKNWAPALLGAAVIAGFSWLVVKWLKGGLEGGV